MSSMKTGFSSTLNRWLGKKNKDKSTPNGKLSKSNTNLTNLSVSTTDINETSQLEYNRITPLPAATSNAPFEQTFRITVLLPKDQLYVTRLGARVPLSKLLELVCEHKLLDAEKYEFRNPVDPSQVYRNDYSIGAVGLSEVRLCHKSDSYDTFNADEVIKLHRTSAIRDSLSSSEFSSRNSKHTMKTTSPYSSSNSLNSMDSTGMNYTRTPVSPPPALPNTAQPKVTAPPRKKRAAPRPPSQMAIPEKSVLTNGGDTVVSGVSPETPKQAALPSKDYFISTPNLATQTSVRESPDIDCNSNTKMNGQHAEIYDNGYDAEEHLYAQVEKKNARNVCGGSEHNLSVVHLTEQQKCPEPSPRRRLIQIKKKSAPAPPQRGSSVYSEDSISITSSNGTPQTPGTPAIPGTPLAAATRHMSASYSSASEATLADVELTTAPQPVAREQPLQASTPVLHTPERPVVMPATAPTVIESAPQAAPKPVPRQTTTTLLNAPHVDEAASAPLPISQPTNVSKVMLNRTPTPEPRSLSCEPPTDIDHSELTNGTISEDDDNHSKQADSGIGEPVPSPLPDSLPSEGSTHECKSTFESSSDDDDMVKVYNFKLGKTVIKPMNEYMTVADLRAMTAAQTAPESVESTPPIVNAKEEKTPLATEGTSWNFAAALPISPPPHFADTSLCLQSGEMEPAPDTPITPKIKERPVLNFEALATDGQRYTLDRPLSKQRTSEHVNQLERLHTSSPQPPTPTSPITEIIDELSAFMNDKRMDSLIKKPVDAEPQIKAAKPSRLTNFSITTITQQVTKPINEKVTKSPEPLDSLDLKSDEEKLYRKRGSLTNGNNLLSPRRSITRADSFHTTVTQVQAASVSSSGDGELSPNTRSASYLSLTKIEQSGLNRRRSSSELSIGESPSLQSLEIIKTILNSRKNSLANSGSDSENRTIITEITDDEVVPKVLKKISNLEESPKTVPTERSQIGASPKVMAMKTSIEQAIAMNKSQVDEPKKIGIAEAPKTTAERLSIVESPQVAVPSTQPKQKRDVPDLSGTVPNEAFIPDPTPTKVADSVPALPSTPIPALSPTSTHDEPEEPELREPKPKDAPKLYRYTGPPNINFSTWNERPKAQVSIKNEGDYIFGGKNASTTNAAVTTANMELRHQRASTPAGSFPEPPPVVATKRDSTIKRMGIPEKDFTVPITVKPLNDVTVESVESAEKQMAVAATAHKPAKPSITTLTLNINNNSNKTSEFSQQPPQQLSKVSNTSTLPRSGAQRFSTPAQNATLLRSTSITQLEAQRPKPTTVESAPAAPFGQNTLRKTGLKEKILAKEQQEQEKAKMGAACNVTKSTTSVVTTVKPLTNGNMHYIKAANSNNSTTTTITTTLPNSTQKPNKTTLQSAKLELKLQKSTHIFINQTSPVTVQLKQSTTPMPPPPPPTATALKTTPTGGLDARDQLLDAIRNFKREELNRT